MQIRLHAALRPGRHRLRLASLLVLAVTLVACSSTTTPSGSPQVPSPSGMTPAPIPSPTPTPLPTPDYSNVPDPTLSALIPDAVDGAPVVKPDPTSYGVSPGDMGSAFGDIGLRFQSLVVAYVTKPRLSLYAARVGGAAVDTADLRPYLVTAGVYIGASDHDPALWKPVVVNGYRVWTRGEDEATLPGTTFYCWSSGQYVFLMTGSSDATNRAMISALPGQPAPTPTPTASPAASGSGAGSSTPPASASESASPSGS
jgi:hypothetical protein